MTTYNLAKENSRELTKVRLCSLLFNVLKMNVVTSLSAYCLSVYNFLAHGACVKHTCMYFLPKQL